MKKIISTFGVVVALGVGSNTWANDCPLDGTWKSDKGKTLQELYKTNIKQSVKSKISKKFGKTKTTFRYYFNYQ